jgi:predicted AlkP superfamily phosphohydrolase/phosphomutase
MVENQTKNIKYVLKNWDLDLLFAFYVATDTIQHFFWGYMDKSHILYKKTKYENAILNLYKKIDSDINEILEIVGEKTNLFILSDHGFQPYEYSIPINYWLKEQGYLRLRKGKGRKFYLSRLLKKSYELVEGSWAEKLIPPEVKSKAVYSFLPKIDEVIDWDASRAYAPTDGGGIYVEDGGTRDELIEKLQEIKNPYTGEKAIRKVYRKEEVYSGEYLDQAPDLLAVPQRRAWITCRLGYSSTVIKRPSILSGSGIHARDGILIARGPDIKGGEEIKADITDIAPTVLRLFGEEIPKEIDGRALEEIFR